MSATTLIDRALIRLSGEDVRGFLQGLITNDVLGDLPIWAGLLTPQGKALFDFLVWADGDDLLIDCERDAAADLAKRLTLYRLRRPIKIAREEILCVHWAAGSEAGIADPRNSALGGRWLAPASGDEGAAELYRAHRLSLGIVEGLAELGSDKTLWLECNARAQNGVSFTKGCYIGQENTARMHHRGKVNRQLAVVAAESNPGESARVWYPALKLAVVQKRTVD
ncbi:MAG: folate-binding protein [Pseudomonadota bacterium]